MIYHTRALILNHFRYGDSSLIVHMYTECMGRQTVMVKGVSGKKSPMHAAIFQPFHLVETDLHHRVNRQMQRISNVNILHPFSSIPFDPVKRSIALFLTEVLSKTLKEEEANPPLFNFLWHVIQTLDLCEHGTANFHLLFLLHYSRYLGFYPTTGYFSNHGPPLKENSLGFIYADTFSSQEYNYLLMQLFEISFEQLDDMRINHEQRNVLAECLLDYYSRHISSFGEINSFTVLRDIFRDESDL